MTDKQEQDTAPQSHADDDTTAAIALGAAVLTRIEDPDAREIAIRNALTVASQSSMRPDLYDAEALMADGEIPMTAAENVLAWLLIEKIGVPDDVGYSPNQAQEIIVRRLEQIRELEQIDDMLDEGQGDDQGHPIMPEFAKGMTTYAKVEACLHLLERRRDALHPSPKTNVRVKHLEWNPFRAETAFGYYHIDDQRDRTPEELQGRPPFLLSGSRLNLARYDTLEAAKAAAQDDFERRILSALITV